MVKPQLEPPTLTGIFVDPAVVGFPVPVRTMVCCPRASTPDPENTILFDCVVKIVYAPATVAVTCSVTVLLEFRSTPTVYVPAMFAFVQAFGEPSSVKTANAPTTVTETVQFETP